MPESTCLYRRPDGRAVVETRFRVRYHETDAMGVVHHAAYITWFEEGRSAFTRCIGYPYAAIEAEGIALAVTEVSARYHRAARYDEEVVVATRLEGLATRGMTFSYEVRRAADTALLVSGMTRHVSVGRDGRVKTIPEPMRSRLLAALREM